MEDLVSAADRLRPVWDTTGGIDGCVSIEVPPGPAYDAEASVEVARRLHDQADRPDILVKIPGTRLG